MAQLKVASALTVVTALTEVFSCHGIPEIVISDNGLHSELFRMFSKQYGFTHIMSSSGYPQAMGEAGRAVAIVRRLCKAEERRNFKL